MKKIALALFALGAFATVAADSNATANNKGKAKNIAEIFEQKLGGRLQVPGTPSGVIGFVNCASGVDNAELSNVVRVLSKEMPYDYKIEEGKLSGLPNVSDVKKRGYALATYIVRDENLPPMLVAPEDRWALVNVARLKVGLKEDVLGKRLLSVRLRCEVMRAFGLVAGAGTSSYQGNIYGFANVEELDSGDPEKLIFDIVQRSTKYLSGIGVTPRKIVSYNMACQQGWAPAPTNDVQRAIWDKVHKMPSKPMKLEK